MLWGSTFYGGNGTVNNAANTGFGTIFSLDPATGAYNCLYRLDSINGAEPCTGPTFYNNKLYGGTWTGGVQDSGVLFQFDLSANMYTVLVNLDLTNGLTPVGMVPYNNKLYGTMWGGGSALSANNNGFIYSLDPASNTYSLLFQFPGASGINDTDGMRPGELLLYNNKFYGATRYGGIYGNGVLFEYVPATNTFHKLVEMWSYPTAAPTNPHPQLAILNGVIYGTGDGPYFSGSLFAYNINSGALTLLHNFGSGPLSPIDTGLINGESPYGLVSIGNMLYGVTEEGGLSFNGGVIFSFDPATGTYIVLHRFNDADSAEGSTPNGKLIVSNNIIYGTTAKGGINNAGTCFSYNPATATFTKLHDFDINNGSCPYGLVAGSLTNSVPNAALWSALKVYPNPATDVLHFDFSGTALSTAIIQLTDVNGRMMISKNLNFAQNKVSITGLVPGCYHYRIAAADGSILQQGSIMKR